MLTYTPSELDAKSQFLQRLQQGRADLRQKVDRLSGEVTKSTALSNDAVAKLLTLQQGYDQLVAEVNGKKAGVEREARDALDTNDGLKAGAAVAGGAVGLHAATLFTIFTGGAGLPALLIALAGTAAAAGAASEAVPDNSADVGSWKKSQLETIEGEYGRKLKVGRARVIRASQRKDSLLEQLKTDEQKRLYFGVVAELLLDNGINIARSLEQFAQFNGVSADAILAIEDTQLRSTLERVLTGQPKAADIERLIAISGDLSGRSVVTPEIRALKQFVNQVVIPNKMYFDILASAADDIRAQDMSTFPPLEILGHKPISLSGKIASTDAGEGSLASEQTSMLDAAKAKLEVRQRVAGGAVYEILKSDDRPHIEKMKALIAANEAEIDTYAGIFADVENATAILVAKQAELVAQMQTGRGKMSAAARDNAAFDARIREIRARNDAKQDAAKVGSKWRAGLAVGGGLALAMIDGGVVSLPLIKTIGAKKLLMTVAGHSLNSAVYGVGQAMATSTENAMLDDYMQSLALQKIDVAALHNELLAVEAAVVKTQESKDYQNLLKDEARRTRVAETLLLRSLIRNGYNNSDEIDAICKANGIGSIDNFLDHYKGTRLGLALKKHCHGLADSNDLSVIIAEANCLRGQPRGADRVLQEYVEEAMKPNIAAHYSKASKMDVIAQHNLTGFGNELHFAAEMQMETNRAVRLLTANEFGMSVVGRQDVRSMFDFWLHRHGDTRLYDDKIRDGEISDHDYPPKRVSAIAPDQMKRFVDMAKRSVASGRASFPKVGDMFLRVCAHEYFLPQAIHVGGKDNIFTDYPESPSAYPMVNAVVREFVRKLSFADITDYQDKVGERLDNVIAQSFIDFFARLGELHERDPQLIDIRNRLKDAAHYDDYAPLFDRYAKSITQKALTEFDLFLDIYKRDLEKHFEVSTESGRVALQEQIAKVKDLEGGTLNPAIIHPGTHEARLLAYDELHTGENLLRRG